MWVCQWINCRTTGCKLFINNALCIPEYCSHKLSIRFHNFKLLDTGWIFMLELHWLSLIFRVIMENPSFVTCNNIVWSHYPLCNNISKFLCTCQVFPSSFLLSTFGTNFLKLELILDNVVHPFFQNAHKTCNFIQCNLLVFMNQLVSPLNIVICRRSSQFFVQNSVLKNIYLKLLLE